MDLNALMKTIMSGDSVANVSQLTGASQSEVQSVLTSVLPSLLDGAKGQAENKETAAGFLNAIKDHAKADTSDLASFMSKVDLEDGGKILGHLLGDGKEAATRQAAEKSGLDILKTGSIIASVAPLLMSLIGQQNAQSQQTASGGGILGKLLSGLFGRK